MRDTIYREDAIEAVKSTKPIVRSTERNWGKMIAEQHSKELVKAIKALPSAEAEPTVIRSRTFMPTKDFKEWAKRIRETNPNAVVIPCDAEVVSAEAVQVVRCKECKSSRVYGKTTQWLACEDVMEGQATDPDGYCYLGERREP